MAQLSSSTAASVLQGDQPPPGRLGRFLKAPLRSSIVLLARMLGVSFPVQVKLFSGDRFRGTIPESVTSAIWRFGYHEALTSLFILTRLRQGDCFIDVGAHFGYFTIIASKAVGSNGRVVAVEPIPRTFQALRQNIALNNLSNVSACEGAAFSHEASIPFVDFGVVYSALNTHAKARGVKEGREHEGSPIAIAARPLDAIIRELGIDSVQMIKIDAESSEEEVLLGLGDTLYRDKPVTIVELGGVSSADEASRIERIFSLMKRFGYRGYAFDGNNLREMQDRADLPYLNVIFEAGL
jgi:FkbM family methyltransferase